MRECRAGPTGGFRSLLVQVDERTGRLRWGGGGGVTEEGDEPMAVLIVQPCRESLPEAPPVYTNTQRVNSLVETPS